MLHTVKSYLAEHLYQLGLWILAFLAPIQALAIAVSVLVMIDTITGIWAAYKRDEQITSNGFRRVLSKTFAYQAVLLTSLLMQSYFIPQFPVITICAGLIAITEFQSIMENASSVTGLNLWKAFIERIHGNKIKPVPKKKD